MNTISPAQYSTPGVVTGQPQAGYGVQGHPGYNQQSSTNTTVVIQQPSAIKQKRDWSSGLFQCTNDINMCLCVWFCSGYFASDLAAKMGENSCLPCCVPGYLTLLRTKARLQGNIKSDEVSYKRDRERHLTQQLGRRYQGEGDICDDHLISTFCYYCALCQLGREVKFMKSNPNV